MATWCFLICRWSIVSACSEVSGTGTSGMALTPQSRSSPFRSCVKKATAWPANVIPTMASTSGFTSLVHAAPAVRSRGGRGGKLLTDQVEVLRPPQVVDVRAHGDRPGLHAAGAAPEHQSGHVAVAILEVAEVLRVGRAGRHAGGLLAALDAGRQKSHLSTFFVCGLMNLAS